MDSQNQKKSQLKALAKYSGIAFQMGFTIFLGNQIGVLLDQKYHSQEGYYSKIITLLSVFLSMYLIIKQVIKDSKNA